MSHASPARSISCAGPSSRRGFLQFGLGGLAGLTLPDLFRLRAASAANQTPASPKSSAEEPTAIILVWLIGGISHLESYDPKPLAPSDYRGPFSPIRTSVPGIDISELLPRHARLAQHFTLVRSLAHSGFCHQQGAQELLNGHPIRELHNEPLHPDIFCIANKVRYDVRRTLPNYVGIHPTPYVGPAYLGKAFAPFAVHGDPNQPQFSVPNIGEASDAASQRIQTRIHLRQQFDRLERNVDRAGTMHALDEFERQAWNVLTRSDARNAFDLSRESPAMRERYGRNRWGQQLLLARRLVESGVDLVATTLDGDLCGRIGNWDDHAVNAHIFHAMQARTTYFDQAVSALIEDLYARGLDRRVLLIVTGEFGRTPKISYAADGASGVMQPGRDHWPNATSLLFAGGGIRTGRTVGSTDRRGEEVQSQRVGPGDFLATLYQHLRINPGLVQLNDFTGRPIPIPTSGKPIPDLIG